jgi:hypothetical protein
MAMDPILESSFFHKGRNLTVRCARQNNEFVVRVFEATDPLEPLPIE